MEPILVNATDAAELLGISRSQFHAKVAQGVLPAPIRVLGPPRWVRQELERAVGAIPSPTADARVPAVAAPLPKPVAADDEWDAE